MQIIIVALTAVQKWIKNRGDNVTIKELKQYRSIRREITEINIELKKLSKHETVIGSDSEYPYTQHVMSVDGVEGSGENVVLMRRLHDCLRRKGMIESFIYSIDDSLTKRIFILRYISGEFRPSWVKVAHTIGGGNTEESVRKTAARYLKKI